MTGQLNWFWQVFYHIIVIHFPPSTHKSRDLEIISQIHTSKLLTYNNFVILLLITE